MPTPRRRGSPVKFPRWTVAAGLTLFLVLSGSGIATAMWTAPSPLSSAVTAGTLTVAQGGYSGMNATYNSSTLTDTAAITVSNTGNVKADSYTVQVIAKNGTALSNATTLTGWYVTSAANCTAGAGIPGGSASATLTAGLSNTGTLAVGATDTYCLRTTVPASYASNGSISEPVLSLNYNTGSWTGTSTKTALQTYQDTVAPSAPGKPVASAVGAAQVTLTWTGATDNVAVAYYDIYRDGVLVGTVTSPTLTFTNTGLVRGATYSYTVTARDAAGNASVASTATSITTLLVDDKARYQVVDSNSGLCIDAGTAPAASYTPLVIWGCAPDRSQSWQFAAVGNFFQILPAASPSFSWDLDLTNGNPNRDGLTVWLSTSSATDSQLWQVIADSSGGGKLQFVNKASAKCLDVQNAQTANGTPLQQNKCKKSAAQSFTLTRLP